MPFKNDFVDNRVPTKDGLDNTIEQFIDDLKSIKKNSVDQAILDKVNRLIFDLNTIFTGIDTNSAKERGEVKKLLEFIQIRISAIQNIKK